MIVTLPGVGLAVVATERIPAGTVVWTRDQLDRSYTAAQLAHLPDQVQQAVRRYGFPTAQGTVVCWDHGKYFNHSCAPNCASSAEFGELVDLAIRDIEPGEQLTDDYRQYGGGDFACACGSDACAGRPLGPAPLWLGHLAMKAAELAPTVAQPLDYLLQHLAHLRCEHLRSLSPPRGGP